MKRWCREINMMDDCTHPECRETVAPLKVAPKPAQPAEGGLVERVAKGLVASYRGVNVFEEDRVAARAAIAEALEEAAREAEATGQVLRGGGHDREANGAMSASRTLRNLAAKYREGGSEPVICDHCGFSYVEDGTISPPCTGPTAPFHVHREGKS